MKDSTRHNWMVATFFLAVVFFGMALLATVFVILRSRSAEPILTISQGENAVTEPVVLPDMSPGDTVSAQFDICVSHRDTVTLHLRADLPQEAPLSDMLHVKVTVEGKDEALYSGRLTEARDITLTLFGEETAELRYTVETALDADAGQQLQGEALAADYVWWVEEAELLGPMQNSWGIVVILIVLLAIALALAMLQLAFIPIRRKRHGERTGK